MIDMQSRLLPHIRGGDAVVATNAFLLRAAHLFGVPTVATVQYVAGLGPTHPDLATICDACGVVPLEKMTFSVLGDEGCREHVLGLKRRCMVVTGIESHVCVQQTVLDLLAEGIEVVVVRDAVSSRFECDLETSVGLMASAGARITTAESLAFAWCERSGTAEFKAMLKLVKEVDIAKQGEQR